MRSKGVKQKVDAVAEAIGTTNDQVRDRISGGSAFLPAVESLAENERVESTVKEVADDLDGVNGALTQGVEHLEVMGQALTDSHLAHQKTEAKLAASIEEGKVALDRAMHDGLTGLPNRGLFDDRLVHAIAMAERHSWTLAVLFVDLDRFKQINDAHGHAAGDRVLQEVARRLLRECRSEDTVCRYGGDEFQILLINPQGRDNVDRLSNAISRIISVPIDLAGGVMVTVGSSIGIARFPDDGLTGPQLVKFADAAMYAAKRRSHARITASA